MSGALVFVDSGVLLASFDGRRPALQVAVQSWLAWCWRARTGRISTQVLNEFYNAAMGLTQSAQAAPTVAAPTVAAPAVTAHQIRGHVRRLRVWQPPHLDRYAVDGAWDLQDRYGLSYWNALIVSSAQQQGCTHLLSLEFAHGTLFDALQVVHPEQLSPSQIPAPP
jgi:predicted nucleic acid-binding protein